MRWMIHSSIESVDQWRDRGIVTETIDEVCYQSNVVTVNCASDRQVVSFEANVVGVLGLTSPNVSFLDCRR